MRTQQRLNYEIMQHSIHCSNSKTWNTWGRPSRTAPPSTSNSPSTDTNPWYARGAGKFSRNIPDKFVQCAVPFETSSSSKSLFLFTSGDIPLVQNIKRIQRPTDSSTDSIDSTHTRWSRDATSEGRDLGIRLRGVCVGMRERTRRGRARRAK